MENKIESKEYIFNYPQLEKLYIILDGLSFSVFLSPAMTNAFPGNDFLGNALIDNACDIIRTIDFCCKRGYYSVGYVLLRELCECILQYLYLFQQVENLNNGITINENERNILKAWFRNTVCKINRNQRQKILSCGNYQNFLKKNNSNVSKLIKLFDKKWDLIDSLNDYVHINGEYYIKHRTFFSKFDSSKEESDIICTIETVGVMLVCLFAMVNPIAFMSDDYVDALEAGIKPKENSQYLVKPFFSEFLQKECDKINSDIYPFIQANNKCGMKF